MDRDKPRNILYRVKPKYTVDELRKAAEQLYINFMSDKKITRDDIFVTLYRMLEGKRWGEAGHVKRPESLGKIRAVEASERGTAFH